VVLVLPSAAVVLLLIIAARRALRQRRADHSITLARSGAMRPRLAP